jgi:hypothetical protein
MKGIKEMGYKGFIEKYREICRSATKLRLYLFVREIVL